MPPLSCVRPAKHVFNLLVYLSKGEFSRIPTLEPKLNLLFLSDYFSLDGEKDGKGPEKGSEARTLTAGEMETAKRYLQSVLKEQMP